jgi:hypothetical protein
LLAACATTKTDPDPKVDEPEIKPDQEIITGELQSDFLELGPAAGVQWLSFYPDDFLEYPELFEGLDADQRRRTRLAPREGANKVLLKFDLPEGAKIKPVDWYGTECVAIDLPDAKGFTVTLSTAAEPLAQVLTLASERSKRLSGNHNAGAQAQSVLLQHPDVFESWVMDEKKNVVAMYASVPVKNSKGEAVYSLVVEWRHMKNEPLGVLKDIEGTASFLAASVKVARELALEGSPKHQCTSSIDDLKAGIVAYEKGGLKLALPEGWELRKSGGSSTVEIHGGGAKPLALIRKLAPKNGSLKTRVGADTVFSRRKARPDGFFGAGRALSDKEPFVIVFDYKDRAQEQVALCVIATGNELLTVEIISTGVIEGEARRKLRDAALEMLSKAELSAIVRNSVSGLGELVGWKPKE